MSNKTKIEQVKRIINEINSNTSVSQAQTRDDLEEVREEIDVLLSALRSDSEDQ